MVFKKFYQVHTDVGGIRDYDSLSRALSEAKKYVSCSNRNPCIGSGRPWCEVFEINLYIPFKKRICFID